MTLADLIRDGRVEPVQPDLRTALASLDEARRHLVSSPQIAGIDPNGAYALLYDAARKAIAAHMLAAGFRVTVRPRAHEAVGLYAVDALSSARASKSIGYFDRMRRKRNRTEYGVRTFGAAEIARDLEHARAIVDAVAGALEQLRRI
jgi:hypothetical protein